MNINYKINNSISVTVQGASLKEAFEQLANSVDVLQHTICGVCQKDGAKPVVRQAQGFTFYEMRCSCGGALKIGVTREGGHLFPQRKDQDGNWKENGGWEKYERQ